MEQDKDASVSTAASATRPQPAPRRNLHLRPIVPAAAAGGLVSTHSDDSSRQQEQQQHQFLSPLCRRTDALSLSPPAALHLPVKINNNNSSCVSTATPTPVDSDSEDSRHSPYHSNRITITNTATNGDCSYLPRSSGSNSSDSNSSNSSSNSGSSSNLLLHFAPSTSAPSGISAAETTLPLPLLPTQTHLTRSVSLQMQGSAPLVPPRVTQPRSVSLRERRLHATAASASVLDLDPKKFRQTMPAACESVESLLRDQLNVLRVKGKTIALQEKDLKDLGEIGKGTFGTVHKIHHKSLKMDLAVKYIRDSMNKREREQIVREVTLIGKAQSPYIVNFYGVSFHEGDIRLYMELMHTSLDKMYNNVRLAGQRIPEDCLGKICVSILKGLLYLEMDLDAMHRDVKPSNMLLGADNSIKLCDFGIAKMMEQGMLDSAVGCEAYLSPERLHPATSRQRYDVRSDVWSFGVSMAELAKLQYPYGDTDIRQLFSILNSVVHGPAPKAPDYYSAEFASFLDACLQKDVTNRPRFGKKSGSQNPLTENEFVRKHWDKEFNVSEWYSQFTD